MTGLEVWVNDLPVARLGLSGGRRQPVNEYLVQGSNQVEIRLTSDSALMVHPEAGQIDLQIEERRFQGDELVGSEMLFDRATLVAVEVLRPGAVLATAGLTVSSAPAAPPLNRATPIGPLELSQIRAKLTEVAGWWREKRLDAVIDWMKPYVADFVRAYPTETVADYTAGFRQMAAQILEGGQVLFEPQAIHLQICGYGRAVDCLKTGTRPAIQVAGADGDVYDFWTVVGIIDGEVRLVR